MFDTLLWDGPADADELARWWAERRAEANDPTKEFSLAVIERASGTMVGGAGLRPVAGDPAILDIGYTLAPAWHGRGYGTELVAALVDEGFRNRGGERIFATIFVGNHASRRVCEKAGMTYEGTLRRAVRKRGVWLDEWMLAITRPDWEQSAG